MSCVFTSPFIFKSVITFSPSPVFIKQLYTLYKLALYIKLTTLNLILNCLNLKLAITVYRGLPIKQFLPYILCVPYIPI